MSKVRAEQRMRLVVAITGASGVIYGKRLLEVLKHKKIETHLIISKAAEKVIQHELEINPKDIVYTNCYVRTDKRDYICH